MSPTPCRATPSAATASASRRRTRIVADDSDGALSVHDVLGPTSGPPRPGLGQSGDAEGGSGAHDLVGAARRLAADLLEPTAQLVDRSPAVPAGHLAALAEAGLFGLAGPLDAGGHDAPLTVGRDVYEALAGACGATFFVWVQHHSPVRLIAASSNQALRQRLLPGLCRGSIVGAVAFAHLRRRGRPTLVARRLPGGGFVLDGVAPWVTSWGLADVVAVGAVVGGSTVNAPDDPDTGDHGDRVVFVAIAARAGPGVSPSPPMALAAMSASSTVSLRFDGAAVAADDVIGELGLAEWRARDRLGTAQPHPAALGLAATCTRHLADLDAPAAGQIEDERVDLRARSYALADRAGPNRLEEQVGDEAAARLSDLVARRAESLDLAVRAATALVVATGGRAMLLDHPAQRLAREAAFYMIQAQTPELRRATLNLLSHRPR